MLLSLTSLQAGHSSYTSQHRCQCWICSSVCRSHSSKGFSIPTIIRIYCNSTKLSSSGDVQHKFWCENWSESFYFQSRVLWVNSKAIFFSFLNTSLEEYNVAKLSKERWKMPEGSLPVKLGSLVHCTLAPCLHNRILLQFSGLIGVPRGSHTGWH